MDGCRICGALTRRAQGLCAACGTDLDDYQTLDSRTADLLIPVRRYGRAPSAAPAVPPPPSSSRRLLLVLACSAAAVGGAVALAVLLGR